MGAYVYLARSRHAIWKIGITSNLRQRATTLNGQSPYPTEMFAWIKVARGWKPKEIEARLHTAFASRRMNGEWFRLKDVSPVLSAMRRYGSVLLAPQA